MIFAETERLYLRALEKCELPRLVELLDVWDIARWLTVLPFPYLMKDAEEFYVEIQKTYQSGEPQFYVLALKSDNILIGGVGLHPPRDADRQEGDVEIGYWLAKDFWGQGLMTEAARAVFEIGLARPATRAITSTTSLHNYASQKVLSKMGLRNIGMVPRTYATLRGEDQVVKWRLTREEYEREPA